jgi:hypothetical protein
LPRLPPQLLGGGAVKKEITREFLHRSGMTRLDSIERSVDGHTLDLTVELNTTPSGWLVSVFKNLVSSDGKNTCQAPVPEETTFFKAHRYHEAVAFFQSITSTRITTQERNLQF